MDFLSQFFIDLACNFLNLLPADPFQSYFAAGSTVRRFFGYLNYFIPIPTLLNIFAAWIAGVAIYYVVQIVLRWVKAIE